MARSVVLKVKNLTKSYKEVKAVQNISFEVMQNEIFGLIGPNGAGKSTTLKMISTIILPDRGSISINDINLVKDSNEARKLISYLPEEAGAYKNMTGKQYLQFMAAMYSDSKSERNDFYKYAENITDLGSRLKSKLSTYSKGMTRKLLLARAFMARPNLAILDEPTSGLDVINALEIRKTIRKLAKEGMSVLLSSHNMLEVEYLSDRVAIIDKGKIIERGTPNELMRKYKAKNLEEVFSTLTTKKK